MADQGIFVEGTHSFTLLRKKISFSSSNISNVMNFRKGMSHNLHHLPTEILTKYFLCYLSKITTNSSPFINVLHVAYIFKSVLEKRIPNLDYMFFWLTTTTTFGSNI